MMNVLNEKLAVDGGNPAVPKHLSDHDWERLRKAVPEEIDAVVEVLKSGHFSIVMGRGMPNSEGLEKEFAEWTGAKYALAVNSGTAALHCAVAGVGVETGDEVIVPAFTFIASAMAVLHHNAIPVFVDIDPKNYLIDPAAIEAKITPRTKAIMPVHIYGLPCDMDEINAIAKKHGLKVIEDAAQAYGPTYKGKKAGNLGDAACFAMTTTKHLMTGEGGLFTTNDEEIYRRASMIRLFGEFCDMKITDREYMSEWIGWNYKMPEVISALGRVKLRNLDKFLDDIKQNAEHFTAQVKDIPGVITPFTSEDRTHSYYHYPVQLDPEAMGLDIPVEKLRNAVIKALAAEGVLAFQWQKVPVPAQPVFRDKIAYGRKCPWDCPHTDAKVEYNGWDYPNAVKAIKSHFVVRGMFPQNNLEKMDAYANAFLKVFTNIDRVIELYERNENFIPLEEKMK